jgi:hypothetical protein
MSFFRHRHDKKPRYKNPSRRRNAGKMVGQFTEQVRLAREYIREARARGFKGEIKP